MSKKNKTETPVVETVAAAVEPVVGNKYPFTTKAQVAERLATDDTFVVRALQILQHRQTSDEDEAGATKHKNARGWMSSHAKRGTELAHIASGEGLSVSELAETRALVSRYTKQLAAHLRDEAIAERPELQEEAACFFQ
jgi:threonine dehydratase